MGLGKFTQGSVDSSSGSNRSGSSRNAKHPEFSIEQYEDGSWHFKRYPNTGRILYEDGKLKSMAPELEKWWMDTSQFRLICSRVEEHFGVDLLEMLDGGEVERAKELITEAAKKKKDPELQKEARLKRSCAVCDEEHHIRYGDFEKVDGSIVCSRHNVSELKEAGVL